MNPSKKELIERLRKLENGSLVTLLNQIDCREACKILEENDNEISKLRELLFYHHYEEGHQISCCDGLLCMTCKIDFINDNIENILDIYKENKI